MNRSKLHSVKKIAICVIWMLVAAIGDTAQGPEISGDFSLALPAHKGQLNWSMNGFTGTQYSAKPNGEEVGVQAKDGSNKLNLLGFLFLFPEQAPMTSARCLDGVMSPLMKRRSALQIVGRSQMAHPGGPSLELVAYVDQGQDGTLVYSIRGFLAMDDVCGDLEIYGNDASIISDPDVKKMWDGLRLNPKYVPQFKDAFKYAQILYEDHKYQAAGPIFEQALAKLKNGNDQIKWRRVATDQAGMAYGRGGDIAKARSIFKLAVANDPDYPMYYYNLACADAEEKNLADARTHLQQAFARKANMIQGEAMPDPTKDDSFLPYRENKEFWTFVESLR